MAYYLMIERRDDWGKLTSYRFGKMYKDMKAAINRCRKVHDSYLLNDKNECIFINTSQTRMIKPISLPGVCNAPVSDLPW